jgi:hypothetical protein
MVENRFSAQSANSIFTFFEVARDLHGRADEVLTEVGLSYREYMLLKRLHDADGTVSQFDALDGPISGADARALDLLESKGLIRVIDGGGLRRTELTTPGLQRAVAGSTRLKALASDFEALLDERERLSLGRLLTTLVG